MSHRNLLVRRMNRLDYAASLQLQNETEQRVRNGEQPDTLLIVEHSHVLTLGRAASKGESCIIASPQLLAARGIEVFETNRGGKATYHGHGQIVAYPIINLRPDRADVRAYVRDLEQVLIRTLADFRVEGFQIDKLTGVYTSAGKVASIGVHIARWITTHGFALNVNTDLTFYNLIIACEGEPVTSMERLLGCEVDMRAVEERLIANFAEVFHMTVTANEQTTSAAIMTTTSPAV